MVTDGSKSGWRLWLEWVVVSTVGVPLAWLVGAGVISQAERVLGDTMEVAGRASFTEDILAAYIFLPVLGLLTGLLQYLLLRLYLPRMGLWVVASALGWPLGVAIVYLAHTVWPVTPDAGQTWLVSLVFISVGAVTGLAQWPVLRRQVSRAGWWVPANVLGWGLIRPVVGEAFTGGTDLLAIGAIPAAVTGAALGWLCRRER